MEMLSKAFLHITSFGVKNVTDYEDKARVTLMNAISVALVLSLILASLGFSLYGSYTPLKSLFVLPVLVLIPFLHRAQWYVLSKFIFIYGLYLLCFVIAIANRRTGAEYGLLTVSVFSVYTFRNWPTVLISFLFGITLYLIYFYLDQTLFFEAHSNVNYATNSTVYLLIGILAIFFEMVFFKKVVQHYSDSFKKSNEQLNLANDELNILNEGLDAAIQERTEDLENKTNELSFQRTKLNDLVKELDDKNMRLNNTINALQKRNYEMDQIIYRLSHNLKAPLCSVAGLCNLMQIDMNLEFVAEALPKINLKIQEMESVFHSVSSLSSINNQTLILSEFSIDGLLEDVIVKYADKIQQASYCLTREKSHQIIHSDRRMLYVVFNHIIQNALMYQARSRPGHLDITFGHSDNFLTISFRDNGIGIPNHLHEKVFDMFFRGTEQSNGSGLGLYIVKEILSRLGGAIELLPVSLGTQVLVRVPISKVIFV